KARKFVKTVEQVTFSGGHAAESGQAVTYVTERCVFRLTTEGLELAEIAPGVDIERDILAHMGFTPVMKRDPKPMDPRIFRDGPMGLDVTLLGLNLADRISYDAERNILFLNFEAMSVRSRADIASIRDAVEERCDEIGRKVAVVVNYAGFRIDPSLTDEYAI